ncbi:MAG: RDD family protein [Planctomycetota bacterium]
MGCPNHPEKEEGLKACVRCGIHFCPDCTAVIAGYAYCAPCKKEGLRDIETAGRPEQYALAGIVSRFAAQLIDAVIIGFIVFLLFGLFFVLAAASETGVLGFFGLLVVFSPMPSVTAVIYEGLQLQRNGQTIGKKVMNLKVINPDGTDIQPGQAWLRGLIRLVLGGCLIDYIPALFSDERLCLHDMIAGTRVVDLT